MSEQSVAPNAAARTPEHLQASADAANALLDRIEVEIARLKRHRPHLEAKITKASNILVAHLAGRPAMPIIRARITLSGKARLLFASLSERGVVYSVDPATWACSCPDHHRRGGICKHGLAGYVLQRVAQAAPEADYQVGEAS